MGFDTPPELRKKYYDRLRGLTPEQRLEKTANLMSALSELALQSIYESFQGISAEEVYLHYVQKLHGRSEETRKLIELRRQKRGAI